MRTVRVTQLKNGLNGLLRSVRAGESVLILDRDVPVARLEPVAAGSLPDERRLQALARQARVRGNPAVADIAAVCPAYLRPRPATDAERCRRCWRSAGRARGEARGRSIGSGWTCPLGRPSAWILRPATSATPSRPARRASASPPSRRRARGPGWRAVKSQGPSGDRRSRHDPLWVPGRSCSTVCAGADGSSPGAGQRRNRYPGLVARLRMRSIRLVNPPWIPSSISFFLPSWSRSFWPRCGLSDGACR